MTAEFEAVRDVHGDIVGWVWQKQSGSFAALDADRHPMTGELFANRMGVIGFIRTSRIRGTTDEVASDAKSVPIPDRPAAQPRPARPDGEPLPSLPLRRDLDDND